MTSGGATIYISKSVQFRLAPALSLMAIELAPLPLPASADASKFANFGREVIGLNPGKLTPEQLKEVQEALYKVWRRYHWVNGLSLPITLNSMMLSFSVMSSLHQKINMH